LSNQSNRLYINNERSDKPLIYGEFDNDLTWVHSDFQVYRANSTTPVLRVFEENGNVVMQFGSLGVGRFLGTSKIEVEGTASKNSSGSWLANSDSRLKREITPLDSKAMLEKALAKENETLEKKNQVLERRISQLEELVAQIIDKEDLDKD